MGWIGEHGLWLSVVRMLALATWRLNQFITLGCELAISLVIASDATTVPVWIINR